MTKKETVDIFKTQEQTLWIALLMDGFWERWRAHGLREDDLRRIRSSFRSVEQWTDGWARLALEKQSLALKAGDRDAELNLKLASLYYNLSQWIYPGACREKAERYGKCKELLEQADQLAPWVVRYEQLPFRYGMAEGRVCVPPEPKGCVVIIVPLDSNKEEVFTYEADFLQEGYATICFDGPGQGDTLLRNGVKAHAAVMDAFMTALAEFAARNFPQLPVHLFGTSSGASWALAACFSNAGKLVSSAAAVSPALAVELDRMPAYFVGRMQCVTEEGGAPLPPFHMGTDKPVWIFHGLKDVMVGTDNLKTELAPFTNSRWTFFEEEGHCCNHQLSHIRRTACRWFGETGKGGLIHEP